MSNFSALKTAIQSAIKQNGNNEITGDILQDILLSIVSTLGDSAINNLETGLQTESQTRGNDDAALSQAIEDEATARVNQDTQLGNLITGIKNNIDNGYVYAGIATPSTTPVSGRVFYIAQIAGTYTNFGNLTVTQGINILKYNGSVWSLDAFIGVDDTLTPSSNNLPKSGNVLENIIKNGSAFDLTAYNSGTTYADLSAALTALDGLQAIYKQPGMSFRFVRSSDNKYVQYRLMSDTFNTTVANWQGVDDEPTAGRDNLVKSGGIFSNQEKLDDKIQYLTVLEPFGVVTGKLINGSGAEISNNAFNFQKYNIEPNRLYRVSGAIKGNASTYVIHFFKDVEGVPTQIGIAVYLNSAKSGYDSVYNEAIVTPPDAQYIYMNVYSEFSSAYNLKSELVDLPETAKMFAIRDNGLLVPDSVKNNMRINNSSLVATSSFDLVSYRVEPNTKYHFHLVTPAGYSLHVLHFFNINGDFLSRADYAGSSTEVVMDYDIETPDNCAYAKFNVPKSTINAFFFERMNIAKILESEMLRDFEILIPTEVMSGKIASRSSSQMNISDNANCDIYKFDINFNDQYFVDVDYGASWNAYAAFFVDSTADPQTYPNGRWKGFPLPRNLSGKLAAYRNVMINTNIGSFFTQIWINVQKNYNNAGQFHFKRRITNGLMPTNDTTDRTAEILKELNIKKECLLGAGDFYVKKLNMPVGTNIKGLGMATRLILIADGVSDTYNYAVKLNRNCGISDLWIDGGEVLNYIQEEEPADIHVINMAGNRHGILMLGTGDNSDFAGSFVERVHITNFTGGGITCEYTGMGTYSSLTVSDVWVRNCCVGINITHRSEFNKFSNIGCQGCRYGVINNGGNNDFANVNVADNTIGYYQNDGTDACVKYDGTLITGANIGHGNFVNSCVVHCGHYRYPTDFTDHPERQAGYSIVMISVSSGMMFSNLDCAYGKIYIENSAYVGFSNMRLGRKSGMDLHNIRYPVCFSNCAGSEASFTPFVLYDEQGNPIVDPSAFDADGNYVTTISGDLHYCVMMNQCLKGYTKITPKYLVSLN